MYAANWRDTVADLPHLTQHTTAAQKHLEAAEQRIEVLVADPVIASRPDPAGFLAAAHTSWTGDYIAAQAVAVQRAQHTAAREAEQAARQRIRNEELYHGPSHGPDTSRDGPSIGR